MLKIHHWVCSTKKAFIQNVLKNSWRNVSSVLVVTTRSLTGSLTSLLYSKVCNFIYFYSWFSSHLITYTDYSQCMYEILRYQLHLYFIQSNNCKTWFTMQSTWLSCYFFLKCAWHFIFLSHLQIVVTWLIFHWLALSYNTSVIRSLTKHWQILLDVSYWNQMRLLYDGKLTHLYIVSISKSRLVELGLWFILQSNLYLINVILIKLTFIDRHFLSQKKFEFYLLSKTNDVFLGIIFNQSLIIIMHEL